MKFLYKLEKKFGKYSIQNLPLILALLFAFDYFLPVAVPDVYIKLYFSPYLIFNQHEYWRLFTWIFSPPHSFNAWTVIELVVLYFLGSAAERGMGTFMFNLYMLGSMLLNFLTVLAVSAFIYYNKNLSSNMFSVIDVFAGGLYVNILVPTIVFFAFAMAYMEGSIMFMLIIPMKAKYMAGIEFAILAYDYFAYPSVVYRALIVVTIANFFIFYNILKRYSLRGRGRYSFTEYSKTKKKKQGFKVRDNENNVTDFADYLNRKKSSDRQMPESITRHKCAICGKTEKDGNDLVFRFCTKCNGSYEYCDEHIYTHEHVK